MKGEIYTTVLTVSLLAMASVSCKKDQDFEESAKIVQRVCGLERFDEGRLRWEVFDVIGPEGPYTHNVNMDFKGSGGELSQGQKGTYSVSNAEGTVTKEYGGTPGTAFLAIPVGRLRRGSGVLARWESDGMGPGIGACGRLRPGGRGSRTGGKIALVGPGWSGTGA